MGSNYFLLQPTNTNAKNGFPASAPFDARSGGFTYHLQNVALLPWYLGTAAPAGSVTVFLMRTRFLLLHSHARIACRA